MSLTRIFISLMQHFYEQCYEPVYLIDKNEICTRLFCISVYYTLWKRNIDSYIPVEILLFVSITEIIQDHVRDWDFKV